jgi:hypothetical protein
MMAASRAREISWRGPLVAWALGLAAFATMLLLGGATHGLAHFASSMALSALALAALALGLVGIVRQPKLIWLVAAGGLFFVAVMFLLSFADVTTRLR